jgi:hypothetical protein
VTRLTILAAVLLVPSPRTNGSFRVFLRPAWMGTRYRATVAGPNLGTTRGPDAQATISVG